MYKITIRSLVTYFFDSFFMMMEFIVMHSKFRLNTTVVFSLQLTTAMISHRTHTAHLENCVNRSQRNELQIKPFRNISLFAIQSLFFCFHEIFLAYFHSAFSQSKHTCFRTHGLDIGTTEFISALNELFQIDLFQCLYKPRKKNEKMRGKNLACIHHSRLTRRLRMFKQPFLRNLHRPTTSSCWYEY